MRAQQTTAPGTDEALLTRAALRAADVLGLTQAELAAVIGVSASTVSRMARGDHELQRGTKNWELATLLVRLYRGLDALVASDEKSLRAWMQNPNHDLNAVPARQIQTVAGLVSTLAYVDASRARL